MDEETDWLAEASACGLTPDQAAQERKAAEFADSAEGALTDYLKANFDD